MKAGTHAQQCTYTIADAKRSCEVYFYLAAPDGSIKVFILATPNGFAFIGSSDKPATENHHVFPVTTVRREEETGPKSMRRPGSAPSRFRASCSHQSITVECGAESEIGSATATFHDDNTYVSVKN